MWWSHSCSFLKRITRIKLQFQKSLWVQLLCSLPQKKHRPLLFYSGHITASLSTFTSSNHSTSSSFPSPNSSAASGSIHTSMMAPLTCNRSGSRTKSRCSRKTASMTRGAKTRLAQSEFCHYYKISRSGIYLSVLVMEAGRNTHFNNSLL